MRIHLFLLTLHLWIARGCHDGGEEEKRKSSGFPDPEGKRKKKAVTRAQEPQKSTKSRASYPGYLYRFRDKPKEDDVFVAHRSTLTREQATIEKRDRGVNPLPIREPEGEMEATKSQEAAHIPKEIVDVIHIIEIPSYTESILKEA